MVLSVPVSWHYATYICSELTRPHILIKIAHVSCNAHKVYAHRSWCEVQNFPLHINLQHLHGHSRLPLLLGGVCTIFLMNQPCCSERKRKAVVHGRPPQHAGTEICVSCGRGFRQTMGRHHTLSPECLQEYLAGNSRTSASVQSLNNIHWHPQHQPWGAPKKPPQPR